RLLEGGLREAGGAAAGLQAARGEAAHLQEETLPDAILAADEFRLWHPDVVEGDRERVHAAVARRRVRGALHHAALGLLVAPVVPVERGLRHDEQREPSVAALRVGIGPREECE